VSLEHTHALYRRLPESGLAIVPGTSHGLLREKPGLCTGMIAGFLSAGPAEGGRTVPDLACLPPGRRRGGMCPRPAEAASAGNSGHLGFAVISLYT